MRDIKTFKNAEYIKHFKHIFISNKLTKDKKVKQFIAKNNIKLSTFLLKEYDGDLSYSTFCKLLRKKDILVDGVRVTADIKLVIGQKVVVYYDGKKTQNTFNVIFKDDNVLVVYKPKGITSERFYDKLSAEYNGLYFCHRLDRNTDGIMIFALTNKAYEHILYGFKHHQFDKSYRAHVYGVVLSDSKILEGYLFKDSKLSFVTISDTPIKGGVKIKTGYKVIKRYENSTLLDVQLYTGKTHQIRAHLAHIGHFILGDGKYGKESINKALGVNDLQLTSFSLKLHFCQDSPLFYLDGRQFCLDI